MENIRTLLTQYSAAEIIIIPILVALSVRFLSDLYDWYQEKVKTRFARESTVIAEYETVLEEMKLINNSLTTLSNAMTENNAAIRSDIDEIKARLESINERLLETMRSSIIDKHHKYMSMGQITDFGLQSLERQYSYYKSAGGNSFIVRLMEDIRRLPIVNSDEAIED